ncbi:MAG: DUF4338 domain-containing protein, partial [Verrucomicrobiota bacterium]|nr:DUF4338 domain-containing protein [Verrucomicrobiota bacterium]
MKRPSNTTTDSPLTRPWSGCVLYKGRDGWIGWDANQRRARLHLVANNARFCRLGPKGQYPNLASR